MSGAIAIIPKFQFFSASGAPLANGTLSTYLSGSTTPATTYQDQALTTANTNPIALDSAGRCDIWLDQSKVYKFVLANAGGVVQWTKDGVNGGSPVLANLPASISDYGSVAGAMAAGGLFAKDEAASGNAWYWGRYMSGALTPGVSSRNLAMGPVGYMFDLRLDSADCGADFMRGLYGRIVFGGSATKGGRIGAMGEVVHSLGATNTDNANRNYVGVQGIAKAYNSDGGTNTSAGAKGAYFGSSGAAYAFAGATNLLEVTGVEFNTFISSTATVRYVFGATIAGINNAHGVEADAALEIGGQSGNSGFTDHIGWKVGVLFSDIHGAEPLTTDAKLISGYFRSGGGRRTIAAGLDTSVFDCTSGIVLGPNLVLTDDHLALGVNGASVSGIQAGNNVSAANLDLYPKGGGAARLYDGASGTGAARVLIEPSAGITFRPLVNAIPAVNGDVTLMLVNNTTLGFKAKGSDGTVRYGFVTLS